MDTGPDALTKQAWDTEAIDHIFFSCNRLQLFWIDFCSSLANFL